MSWLKDNKEWIKGDLKDLISDLDDEHYGFYIFIKKIERKIKLWKADHDLPKGMK